MPQCTSNWHNSITCSTFPIVAPTLPAPMATPLNIAMENVGLLRMAQKGIRHKEYISTLLYI